MTPTPEPGTTPQALPAERANGLTNVHASTWRRLLVWCLSVPQQTLILLVRGYRLLLKPWLGSACRFEPTCSAYTLQALQQHGALRGSALGGWRLLRCHPWCEGGCDAVPDTFAPWPRRSVAPSGGDARTPVGDAVASPAAPAPGLFSRLLDPARSPAPERRPDSSANRPRP